MATAQNAHSHKIAIGGPRFMSLENGGCYVSYVPVSQFLRDGFEEQHNMW